jgi:hypothetical protein
MTFDEMVQQVIIKTNRPDMTYTQDGGSGEIPSAIVAATMSLHHWDGNYFFRDLTSAVVQFSSSSYTQVLDTSPIVGYRAPKLIKRYDPTASTDNNVIVLPTLYDPYWGIPNPNDDIAIIELGEYIDPVWKLERTNVAYQAGSMLNIKSAVPFLYCILYYYINPTVGTISDRYAGYNSWIASQHPWAIIYAAVSNIYSDTGQQDQSRSMDSPPSGLNYSERTAFLKSQLLAKGY